MFCSAGSIRIPRARRLWNALHCSARSSSSRYGDLYLCEAFCTRHTNLKSSKDLPIKKSDRMSLNESPDSQSCPTWNWSPRPPSPARIRRARVWSRTSLRKAAFTSWRWVLRFSCPFFFATHPSSALWYEKVAERPSSQTASSPLELEDMRKKHALTHLGW